MCEIAKIEPQLAHSAYVIGVSKEWSFLTRTTPGIKCYLQEIEDAILHKLLPAITGQPFIDDTLRNIMGLPARLGGLGIENPVIMAELECANSVAVTSKLCEAIVGQKMCRAANLHVAGGQVCQFVSGKYILFMYII